MTSLLSHMSYYKNERIGPTAGQASLKKGVSCFIIKYIILETTGRVLIIDEVRPGISLQVLDTAR